MWVVHEIPGAERLFIELREALKPGACFLVAEPKRHVSPEQFESIAAAARAAGLTEEARPEIRLSMGLLLKRG